MPAIATAPTVAASPNARPLEGSIAPTPEIRLPAIYTAEDVEGFDGAEILIGAERGELPKSDLPDVWTEENAGGEEEEEESGERRAESGNEEGEGESGELKAESGNEEAKTEAAPEIPEAARTQLETLAKERDELKARLEELGRTEVATMPTGTGPLAHVTDEKALLAHQHFAESIKEWADENRNGGELPRALQAALHGVEVKDITEPLVLDGNETYALLKNARKMLREHLPNRRKFLTVEKNNEAWVRANYPDYFDSTKPEGQFFAQFQREVPALKTIPKWPVAMACLVRGHLAFTADLKAAEQQAAAAKTPARQSAPAAPVPPTTGTARGGAKPTIAKPNRTPQLKASMSAEELVDVL